MCVLLVGWVCQCVCACVHVRVHEYKYPCSVMTCIGLGNDSGVSMTILGNMITHAHSIHGPCSYFQRVM